MDRAAYANCMRPWISGAGKTPEERKLNFCMGAKICSGKTSDKDEARKMCEASAAAPRPAGEPRTSKKAEACPVNVDKIVDCIEKKATRITTREQLREVMLSCMCHRGHSPRSPKSEKAAQAKAQIEALPPEVLKSFAALSGIWKPKAKEIEHG